MNFTDKLQALKGAVAVYVTALKELLTVDSLPVVEADNSERLEGKTLTEIKTLARGDLTYHASLNDNPHHLTPDLVDSYGQSHVDLEVGRLVPAGVLSVSRLGTLDFLPVGVAGTFEGATTINSPQDIAMNLEDDGTLIYLRTGSNGSNFGVYYSYIKNAVNGPWVSPIATNYKYQPPYFPAGVTARNVRNSSNSIIFGETQDSDGTVGDYYISITHGTFDPTKHVGAFITRDHSHLWAAGSFVDIGDKVLLFQHTEGSDHFGIRIYELSKASILAGGYVSPTLVTGITTTGFHRTVSNVDRIHLADRIVSRNAADQPLVHIIDDTITATNPFHWIPGYIACAVDDTGMIRLKMVGNSYYATRQISTRAYLSLSLTYDPVTKTSTLDPGLAGLATVELNPTETGFIITGPIYATIAEQDGHVAASNRYVHMHYTDTGQVYTYISSDTSNTKTLFRAALTDFVSKYDSLRVLHKYSSGMTSVRTEATYGSAVGGRLNGPIPMADDKLIVYTDGRNDQGISRQGMAWSMLEGSPTGHTYKSIYNGSYLGYRPSADRGFISDLGISERGFYAPLVEVTGSQLHVSSAQFSEDMHMEGPVKLNPDFSSSGAVSLTPPVIDKITSLVKASIVTSEPEVVFADTHVQVIVPQIVDVPPFALVSVLTTTGHYRFYLVALSITGGSKNSTITDVEADYISDGINVTYTALAIHKADQRHWQGPAVIYETPTAFLIGIVSAATIRSVGDTPCARLHFKYTKSNNRFSFATTLPTATRWHINHSPQTWFATPTLGFGIVPGGQGVNVNDEFTKAVFAPIAKTEAEFDAFDYSNRSTYRVLVSQDVADGWVVYFTESTPLVMDGRYYQLTPTSIDLSVVSPDPTNKTFHVYAVVTDGVAGYEISLSQVSDTSNRLRIGTIATGNLSIETIDIQKPLLLGPRRIDNQDSIPIILD